MMSRTRPQSLPPETSDEITLFLADLAREGKAQNTIEGYRRDLRDFVRYFERTTDEQLQEHIARFWAAHPLQRPHRDRPGTAVPVIAE